MSDRHVLVDHDGHIADDGRHPDLDAEEAFVELEHAKPEERLNAVRRHALLTDVILYYYRNEGNKKGTL